MLSAARRLVSSSLLRQADSALTALPCLLSWRLFWPCVPPAETLEDPRYRPWGSWAARCCLPLVPHVCHPRCAAAAACSPTVVLQPQICCWGSSAAARSQCSEFCSLHVHASTCRQGTGAAAAPARQFAAAPQKPAEEDDDAFELLPPGCSLKDPTYGRNFGADGKNRWGGCRRVRRKRYGARAAECVPAHCGIQPPRLLATLSLP